MTPLRVLIVEDSENDALLLELELRRAGFQISSQRVETAEAMRQALHAQDWDLIVADYVMPRFNGLAALGLVKEKNIDIPFIIVSGHIADDTAVAAMKAGAHDYVMKDNYARLGPAIRRELREAAVRHERRRSEQLWREEQTFRQAVENSVPSGITAVDLEGRQTYVNPAFCRMVGWSQAELLGAKPPFPYWPVDQIDHIAEAYSFFVNNQAPPEGLELRYRKHSGEVFDVLVQATPLRDAFGNITGWVSSSLDITERKRAEARLAAEHAITRILASADSLVSAAPDICQAISIHLEIPVVLLWTVHPDSQTLQLLAAHAQHSESEPLLQLSRSLSLKPGEDLPGLAWQSLSPTFSNQLTELLPARRELAAKQTLSTAAAFPIRTHSRILAVLELLSPKHLESSERLVNMMAAISGEITQFIHRCDAEANLRRANDELELRVQQRTAELKTANVRLKKAISDRHRLEQELLDLTEKERRRIGLDLHDDLGQKLAGIAMMVKGLSLRLEKTGAEESQDASRINDFVQEALNHTRSLARDLTTLELQETELDAALQGLCQRVKEMFSVKCSLETSGPVPTLDPAVILHLYKITQECITNAIKHAKAASIRISLQASPSLLSLSIENNGYPFPDMHSPTTGMGLRIMSYRASLIGGEFSIHSAGAQGAIATCTLPLDPASPS